MCTFFGERKGLRFHEFPTRAHGGNLTTLGDHRRRGNKHTSHIRHSTHQLTRNMLTIRQVLRLIQEVFPRKITTTLQISPLTKNSKGLNRKTTLSISFGCHRFVLNYSSTNNYLSSSENLSSRVGSAFSLGNSPHSEKVWPSPGEKKGEPPCDSQGSSPDSLGNNHIQKKVLCSQEKHIRGRLSSSL